MTELKPCPFCGGEAHTYRNHLWHVACERAWHGCVTMSAFVTEAEAVEAWNARAERTCKIDYERHCSNCGVYVHESAVLVRKDLDGGFWTVVSKPASYCPNCGAKVVDE